LQVAQVGRRLAERLIARSGQGTNLSEQLDPDVVEAACLAHDLGHPPFGHIAEEELNRLSEDFGGFEGNAQSFRIVTKLAFLSENHRGLNLTRASLASLLKYPWLKGESRSKPGKWGAYESEKTDYEFATGLCPESHIRTVEAELMDWADDVTYSVHDIEDFYRAGRMPLHLLAQFRDPGERKAFFDDVFHRRKAMPDFTDRRSELEEAFTNVMISNFPIETAYSGTAAQRAALRFFTSNLISRYINGVELQGISDRCTVVINPEFKSEVAMLKELVWTYVIEAPALATQQYGQRRLIRELLEIYSEAAGTSESRNIFPAYYQERLDAAGTNSDEINRTCIDLIASLTESQVVDIHHRLTGSSLGSGLEDLIV
jgi:dGTPase